MLTTGGSLAAREPQRPAVPAMPCAMRALHGDVLAPGEDRSDNCRWSMQSPPSCAVLPSEVKALAPLQARNLRDANMTAACQTAAVKLRFFSDPRLNLRPSDFEASRSADVGLTLCNEAFEANLVLSCAASPSVACGLRVYSLQGRPCLLLLRMGSGPSAAESVGC